MAKRVEKLGEGYFFPSLETLRRVETVKDRLAELMKHAEYDTWGRRLKRSGEQGEVDKILTYAIESKANRHIWSQLRDLYGNSDAAGQALLYPLGLFLDEGKISISNYEWFLRTCGTPFDSPDRLFEDIQMAIQRSDNEPVNLDFYGHPEDWIYKGYRYEVSGEYSADQFRLLIMEEFDKERRYFERLKRKFESPDSTESARTRPRIPEQVRIQVWRRDGGKCARCGSRDRLEYDHIVPISRGGSNTTRNIELLCESCNRSKSDKIE